MKLKPSDSHFAKKTLKGYNASELTQISKTTQNIAPKMLVLTLRTRSSSSAPRRIAINRRLVVV